MYHEYRPVPAAVKGSEPNAVFLTLLPLLLECKSFVADTRFVFIFEGQLSISKD